ncbi:MAG: BamA/TamA family outer membrane protein [Candidatus Marinimicrobia bacterium]|nr:BamA/TamA family outer membrane protein [Candidatus Neomarinimicrobiota bacterium]
MRRTIIVAMILVFFNLGLSQSKKRTGWGWGGVPALNYNADDGFGYGILLDLFNYGTGGYSPYYFKINTIIFFTTGGKQDHTLFFDAPYLLGSGIRLNVRFCYKTEDYYPYFGLGNDSEYNADYIETDDDNNSLDTLHGKHYYTVQSDKVILISNLQKALVYREDGKPKISALAGLGIIHVNTTENENDGIVTKFRYDIDSSGVLTSKDTKKAYNNFLKFGIIYDTRDNEPAPNTGVWTDLIGEWYTKLIGSNHKFLRLTFTDRRYFRIMEKLVYANRILVENIFGDAPYTMYYPIGSSFRYDEGLGGYRTIRGVFKNRYIGTTKFLVNMELRYRFYEFSFASQNFYLAANVFYDFGRVWHENDSESGIKNMHDGKGIGLHVAWNENFIVYADMGFSKEAGSQLYIDIGYLF